MKLHTVRLLLISFSLYLMSGGCSGPGKPEPPETVSEVLNAFVRSAPHQYINLDEIRVRQINLRDEDIIYSVNQTPVADEPLLGRMLYITHVGEQFYVYDGTAKAIFRIDMDGTVQGPLTREGRGPGEHLVVGRLRSNGRYIYATDMNNARINRYSYDMVPKDPLRDFYLMSMDLNDKIILSTNQYQTGFAPAKPGQGVIAITPTDNLNDTLATILPRIIPPGYQPNVYNIPRFSVNRHSSIAASYRPLPWIFLFDEEYNHTLTLILEYSIFEDMDIPAMDFFKPKGNKGFGGAMPISQYRLTDDGELFLSIRRELIHLAPSADGGYRLVGKYTINFAGEGKEESLWVSDIFPAETDGEFYAGNWEYLFRFTLPD